jgi:hypothetical protein
MSLTMFVNTESLVKTLFKCLEVGLYVLLFNCKMNVSLSFIEYSRKNITIHCLEVIINLFVM